MYSHCNDTLAPFNKIGKVGPALRSIVFHRRCSTSEARFLWHLGLRCDQKRFGARDLAAAPSPAFHDSTDNRGIDDGHRRRQLIRRFFGCNGIATPVQIRWLNRHRCGSQPGGYSKPYTQDDFAKLLVFEFGGSSPAGAVITASVMVAANPCTAITLLSGKHERSHGAPDAGP